jgi:6-phospho-3-hexuloisomerase
MEVIAAGQIILEEMNKSFNKLLPPQTAQLLEEIKQAKRIFCVGAGRSRIILNAFCMRLNQLGLESYVAGNVPCPPAKKGDLIIAASGSATTPSVNAILKRAKESGAKITLITASSDHNLSGISDHVVTIIAPCELVNKDSQESRQIMRTLFEQVCFILYEGIIAALSTNIPPEEIASRHTNLE